MMKNQIARRLVLVTIFCFVLFNGQGFSQQKKDPGNLYTKWVTLALLGKNQAEIEYYFRNIDEPLMNKIKERIRFTVLDNLRRSGIRHMIQKSGDMDDIRVVLQKIIMEIRYIGLEHDQDLRLSIREEFGVLLETL